MKRQYVYTLALSAALLSTAACRKDIPEPIIPDDQKGLIVLSMSDEAAGAGTKAGFSAATRVVARISSTDGSNTRHTRTMMDAAEDATLTFGSTSAVDYAGDAYKRYWDDAFGRKAKLSVYAIAVPEKATGVTNDGIALENKLSEGTTSVGGINTSWKTDTEDNNVRWAVATQQSEGTLSDEDLCYSNNIQDKNNGGHDGRLVYDKVNYPDTGYPSFEYKDHDNSCTHPEFQHDFYPTLDDGQMVFKLDDGSNTDGPGHFDRGHMIFRHALTRITIELIGGEGFDYGNSSSFTFNPQSESAPASIALLNVNTSGTLNIQSGVWSSQSPSEHTYMSRSEKASGEVNFAKGNTIYTLAAQIIPGNTVQDNSTTNILSFNIDDNNYYVTQDMVFDALNTEANTVTQNQADGSTLITVEGGNKITFEQGKNYKFKITVNKTGIKAITCSLVDWKDVEATFTPSNAYITFESLSTSDNSKNCEHFDLYRILNVSNTITSPYYPDFDGDPQYMTGYTSPLSTDGDNPGITKVSDASPIKWKTTWFFESNKTFYHFRSVNPGTAITPNENGDYFTMYSGPVNDEYSNTDLPAAVGDGKYNDYHWGAIYKTGTKLTYDPNKGFEDQLAGPIGPTSSTLNIIEQHMMSNINIYLLTPATSDGNYTTASVDLYDETKENRKVSEIELTNYAGSATVRMGTGLITPTPSSYTSSQITPPAYNKEYGNSDNEEYYLNKQNYQFDTSSDKYYHISKAYTYRVVPQALVVGDNKVGLKIHTPDDNIYYVVEDLSKIKVSTVTDNSLKDDHTVNSEIDRWYPGYSYNYYFVLTKKGIEAITCTIVDYVDVNANGFDIDLES